MTSAYGEPSWYIPSSLITCSYHLFLSSALRHTPHLPSPSWRRGAVPPHFSTASTSSRHRAAPSPSPPVSRRRLRLRLRPPWAFAFSAGDRHRQHAAGAGARTRARERADTRPQLRLSRFEAEWLSGSLREIELHRRRPGAGDFVIIEQGGARFPLFLRLSNISADWGFSVLLFSRHSQLVQFCFAGFVIGSLFR